MQQMVRERAVEKIPVRQRVSIRIRAISIGVFFFCGAQGYQETTSFLTDSTGSTGAPGYQVYQGSCSIELFFEEVRNYLLKEKINVNGCFHIGAHNCEELKYYNSWGVKNEDVIWIDAIPSKVSEAISRGIPNVYSAVITDKDDEDVVFNLANNVQSSSVLDFGSHSQEHPSVFFVDKIELKSVTIDTFFHRNNIDPSKYNFWNFDIQGAELMALKGAIQTIKHAKVLYLEVNENELYKNCGTITEIDMFLSNYNFTRVMTYMTEHGWGDALYVFNE